MYLKLLAFPLALKLVGTVKTAIPEAGVITDWGAVSLLAFAVVWQTKELLLERKNTWKVRKELLEELKTLHEVLENEREKIAEEREKYLAKADEARLDYIEQLKQIVDTYQKTNKKDDG